jgi:hypothetical protein
MTELKVVEPIQQMNIGLAQDSLDEWIEERADKKKPMTPRAIKMLTKKLLQWSEADQVRCIENAIERGWDGVYWVDPPKGPTQTSTRDRSLQDDLTDTSWAR